MKVNLYTVYDKVAKTFANPYTAPNDVHAMRSFRMEINRAHDQNVLYNSPQDFQLHRCGTVDLDTGVIEGSGPELVSEASALIQGEK